MRYDLVIKNGTAVLPQGENKCSILIKEEKIVEIADPGALVEADEIIDAAGRYVVPGGVDPHVHIRYPGGAHRENFFTGTCAAAAGGTTTIIEHPISEPPQYAPDILAARAKAFCEQSIVDGAFLGAAGADHLDQIVPLAKAGVCGFKTFLHEPPEGREKEFEGLCCSNNDQLMQALSEIQKTGLLAAAHTEDNDLVSGGIRRLRAQGMVSPIAHCLSRPPVAEELAVQRLLTLAKETGTRCYLVHISSPGSVRLAMRAREEGQEVYIETCPQYLYMDETWLEQFGPYVKCNPALRKPELAEELWQYVEDGTIDTIASDHAPYTVEEKERGRDDIFAAPSGFPGLETRGPFLWKAVKDGRISMQRAVDLLSTNPARIFGLQGKGSITPGADADLVILDPCESYELQADSMLTQAKDICHFLDGFAVSGRPQEVFLRGRRIFADGKVLAAQGSGKTIGLSEREM